VTKAVVFDLDGTLADTADLVGGNSRRKPADVLMTSEPGARGRSWRFDDHRDLIPGNLAALGYRVAIVTASPTAYASTLADLLNIDFERLLAGGPRSKAEKLRHLADFWGIDSIDMCYVGDRYQDPNSDDIDAADEAGCEFIPAEDIAVLRHLPRITTNTSGHDTASRSAPDSPSGDRVPCPNPRCTNTATVTLARLGFRCPICRTNFRASPPLRPVVETGGTRQVVDAFIGLKNDPGRQDRRELQTRFLSSVPQKARDCVIERDLSEGRFQFPPWLLSKSEIRQDSELRALAMEAAARLFPVLPPRGPILTTFQGDDVPVESLVPYRDGHKALMQKLKDFRNRSTGSGPEVHQSLGYFPALALAGHLRPVVARSPDRLALVPVPCHDFSNAHPGQFSLRLAERVARLIDIPLLPVLDHGTGLSDIRFKNDHALSNLGVGLQEHLETADYDGPLAILLDDQYTRGRSMRAAMDSLEGEGWSVVKAMTWSQSMQHDVHCPSRCFFRDRLGPSWTDCACPHLAIALDMENF